MGFTYLNPFPVFWRARCREGEGHFMEQGSPVEQDYFRTPNPQVESARAVKACVLFVKSLLTEYYARW
jgi:hypothetical protein